MLGIKEKKQHHLDSRPQDFYRYLGLVAVMGESGTSSEFIRQQVVTELAESLDAPMGTKNKPIQLQATPRALVDIDGRDIRESAVEWARTQHLRASADPRLEWFAEVADIEADEQNAVLEFAHTAGNGASMLVVSPFPEEAYSNSYTCETVKQEGFRPDIRRAFVRVYQKTENGIQEHVQSVDSSELSLWNRVFETKGIGTFKDTKSLLKNRAVFQFEEPQEIINEIVSLYDQALITKKGIKHKYGRSEIYDIEANLFVESYPVIIDDTIRELSEIMSSGAQADKRAQRIFYNSKALLAAAHRTHLSGQSMDISANDVRVLRSSEGSSAAQAGVSFGGCSGDNSVTSQSQDSALSAESTFSMGMKSGVVRNGVEAVDCINCPGCSAVGVAYRDPSSKKWLSCNNGGCGNYNEQVVDKFYNRQKSQIIKEENIILDCFRFWGVRI
jgi:hypothetical protein